MPSKSLKLSEALGFGWNIMKSNFLFFAGVLIVVYLISLLGQSAAGAIKLHRLQVSPFWFFVLFGVTFIVQIILAIGLIKIALSFCDGQAPGFGTLFSVFDCFWRFLVTMILYNLIINGTVIVCLLPFLLLSDVKRQPNPVFIMPILAVVFIVVSILVITLAMKFFLSFYFVVDKKLGPVKALKASSLTTAGAKGPLFFFFILCGLINLLGALCCFVGTFATFPTVMVAMALVYRRLSEQTPELAELGIAGATAQPGSIASGIHNTSGIRLDPAIAAVINARPDQGLQSRSGPRPAGGTQYSANAAAQSDTGIQLSQGAQTGPAAQSAQTVQSALQPGAPADGLQSVLKVQREGENKSNSSLIFWLVALAVVGVAFAGGIGYRFWSKSKAKAAVSTKNASATPEVLLKGILYSDNPSAIIDGKIAKEGDIINGIKVVKIHKEEVEFEKDGVKWTQRAR